MDCDYAVHNLLIVGVLKGAVMVVADFVGRCPSRSRWTGWRSVPTGRARRVPVVRILKDLDADLAGRDVLIVEDILDSGSPDLAVAQPAFSRGAASVEVLTLLRKPDAMRTEVDVRYLGLRHPQRLRGGVWPGLRREVPQPGLRGQAVAARLRRTDLLRRWSRCRAVGVSDRVFHQQRNNQPNNATRTE
ncbi:MAG: hypothetical protein U0R28_11320 [Candidatus Nanopelagicales bacterium]